jgi:SAM-dependent methyltransferase
MPAPWLGRLQGAVRARIAPLAEVAALVPPGGRVRELGCGEGLLLALVAPRAERVIGVDFDPRKCRQARARLARFPDVEIREEDILAHLAAAPRGGDRAVLLSDTLSSLSFAQQDEVLRGAIACLAPGGALVLKIIDTEPAWKTRVSTLVSSFTCGFKLSLSAGQSFRYRPRGAYREILAAAGLTVEEHLLHERLHHPVPHVVVIGRRG